jgi:integrase
MTKIRLKYVHEYRDRKGNVRRYVRRPGMRKVTLKGLPGSPEFMEAYTAAMAGEPAPEPKHGPGSVDQLVMRYYASPKFANLGVTSQATYREVLGKFCETHGHRLATGLTIDKAEKIISDIGASRPAMANLVRSILSAVFRYAVKLRIRPDNPFSSDAIEPYKIGTHHTWTDGELEAYRKRWPVGTRERLAFAVLLYSGQRVGDAVKLRRSDVLTVTQQKTGTPLKIAVHPALARAVRAGPSNGVYIIGDANGRPINADSLSDLIRRASRAAGLPPRCKTHGLRKANQRLLAERGATTKQMQAVSGHKSLQETERYSVEANQAGLAAAAIALLPDEE